MATPSAKAPTPTVAVTGQHVAPAPLPPCASAALHPATLPAGKPATLPAGKPANTPPADSRTAEPRNGGPPRDGLNTRTPERPNARTQTLPEPHPSLELLRAELLRFQRWVYQVLLRTHLIPPVTIFLVVALGGLRKRGSWYIRRCWQTGEQRPDEICLAGEALADPLGALAWVLLALLEQAAAAAEPRARHGRRAYRRLKAAAEALGLHLERSRGGRWARAIPSGELRHRIEAEFLPNWAAFAAVRDAPRAPSRPKPPRWRCACPRPRSVRRVNFDARCLVCGATFVRVDPWPPRTEKAFESLPASSGAGTTVRPLARQPLGGFDSSPEAAVRNGGTPPRLSSLAPPEPVEGVEPERADPSSPPSPPPGACPEPVEGLSQSGAGTWPPQAGRARVRGPNGGTLEPLPAGRVAGWRSGTPLPLLNCRTAEQPNSRTLSPPAVSGVEPAISLEPVYADWRRLVRFATAELLTRLTGRPLQIEPEFVIQPQGSRSTVTWFRPATWHGDGPSRPEIGMAAEALRDPPAVYAGILHELVHQWAWENGIRDVNARRNYHSVAFRDLAERIGLVAQRAGGRGWAATSLSEELRQALAEDFQWNLAAFAAFRRQQPPAPGLPRWRCGCPITLRGMRLAIHCNDCATDFARVPDAPAPTALASRPVSSGTVVRSNVFAVEPAPPTGRPGDPMKLLLGLSRPERVEGSVSKGEEGRGVPCGVQSGTASNKSVRPRHTTGGQAYDRTTDRPVPRRSLRGLFPSPGSKRWRPSGKFSTVAPGETEDCHVRRKPHGPPLSPWPPGGMKGEDARRSPRHRNWSFVIGHWSFPRRRARVRGAIDDCRLVTCPPAVWRIEDCRLKDREPGKGGTAEAERRRQWGAGLMPARGRTSRPSDWRARKSAPTPTR